MPREKGTLPRAYLRMDPDLDQHDDPLAMVLLMCAAGRQKPRGRFRGRVALERVLGKKRLAACLERGDLVALKDGGYYLDGWDEWQEGDYTVGDRMARLRSRRRSQSQNESIPNGTRVEGMRQVGHGAERVLAMASR